MGSEWRNRVGVDREGADVRVPKTTGMRDPQSEVPMGEDFRGDME